VPSRATRVVRDYAQRSNVDPALTKPDTPALCITQPFSLGASASPLLANIYLHYVLDRWVRQSRRRHAHGDVIIVRFADDFGAGFEHKSDAERFLADLRERFSKFGLELHPDKTRLIEFGRNAARDRAARDDGKPETFDFLGHADLRVMPTLSGTRLLGAAIGLTGSA